MRRLVWETLTLEVSQEHPAVYARCPKCAQWTILFDVYVVRSRGGTGVYSRVYYQSGYCTGLYTAVYSVKH